MRLSRHSKASPDVLYRCTQKEKKLKSHNDAMILLKGKTKRHVKCMIGFHYERTAF